MNSQFNLIKLLSLIILIGGLVFVSSCSDDDSDDMDDTPAATCTDGIQNGNETGVDCGGDCDPCDAGLEGEWKVVMLTTTNCADSTDNANLDLTDSDCIELAPGFETCFDIRLNFGASGEFSQISEIELTGFPAEVDTTLGTYTISGNEITICPEDSDCDTGTYSVSGNTMQLEYNDSENGCNNDITAEKQ